MPIHANFDLVILSNTDHCFVRQPRQLKQPSGKNVADIVCAICPVIYLDLLPIEYPRQPA